MGSLLGIGAGAGFVSALLFAVVTTGNPLAIILYLVAPLPVLLAALGWNHRAGLAAALPAACIVGLAFSIPAGLLFSSASPLPAWWFAYLVLLARTEGATTEWYPLGRLLLWMVAISAMLTFVGALMLAADYDAFVAQFERADKPDRADQSRTHSRALLPKAAARRRRTSLCLSPPWRRR